MFSLEHLVDDRRCAADAGVDGHCPPGTVALAGSAFDAGVTPGDLDLSLGGPEHLARTNGKAGAATITRFRVMGKGDDVFEVNHGFHNFFYLPKRAMAHKRSPAPVPAISSGRANRISLLTPESEVKVEDPVKFIAT